MKTFLLLLAAVLLVSALADSGPGPKPRPRPPPRKPAPRRPNPAKVAAKAAQKGVVSTRKAAYDKAVKDAPGVKTAANKARDAANKAADNRIAAVNKDVQNKKVAFDRANANLRRAPPPRKCILFEDTLYLTPLLR